MKKHKRSALLCRLLTYLLGGGSMRRIREQRVHSAIQGVRDHQTAVVSGVAFQHVGDFRVEADRFVGLKAVRFTAQRQFQRPFHDVVEFLP
jgi:hypothetical protein